MSVFFKFFFFTHKSHAIIRFMNEAEGPRLNRNLANHFDSLYSVQIQQENIFAFLHRLRRFCVSMCGLELGFISGTTKMSNKNVKMSAIILCARARHIFFWVSSHKVFSE